MSVLGNTAVSVLFCGLALSGISAQDQIPNRSALGSQKSRPHKPKTLNREERKTVIATALASKQHHSGEHDCSHLVHAIYQRAGFPYPYADSDDLYDGAGGFLRVSQPEPADLVVWHGHVGIVTRPSRHEFFSFLSKGPGVNDYRSRYWKGRGEPRFYRYVKNELCPACTVARGNGD